MTRRRPLIWEQLEGRLLRAAIGLAWREPTHLTLSFAPDGTAIAGDASVLFQDLDAQFPNPTAWQDVIASAFQSWAAQTNISIGLVADDGAPFGVAGQMQGNPGFGDIRNRRQAVVSGSNGHHGTTRPLYVRYAIRRHDPQQRGRSQSERPLRCGASRSGPRPWARRKH